MSSTEKDSAGEEVNTSTNSINVENTEVEVQDIMTEVLEKVLQMDAKAPPSEEESKNITILINLKTKVQETSNITEPESDDNRLTSDNHSLNTTPPIENNNNNNISASDGNVTSENSIASCQLDHGYSRNEINTEVKQKRDRTKLEEIVTSLVQKKKSLPPKKRKAKSYPDVKSEAKKNCVQPKKKKFNQPIIVSSRCLEPFAKGWRRELVHRKTISEDSLRVSDVYYFSPDGFKLRSYREVADYLKSVNDPELSLECFTYRKLLVHKPPEEIERNAGDAGVPRGVVGCKKWKTDGIVPKSEPQLPSNAHTNSATSSKNIKKRFAAKSAADGIVPKSEPQLPSNAHTNSATSSKNIKKRFAAKSAADGIVPKSELQLPSIAHTNSATSTKNIKKRFAAKLTSKSTVKLTSQLKKLKHQQYMQRLVKEAKQSKQRKNKKNIKNKLGLVPCSLNCPEHVGIIPTLKCLVCLCMFHPDCVGVRPGQPSFRCVRCCYQQSAEKRRLKENVQQPKKKLNSDLVVPPTVLPELDSKQDNRKGSDETKVESSLIVEIRSADKQRDNIQTVEIKPSFYALPRLTAAPPDNNRSLLFNGQLKNRPPPPLKAAPFALPPPLKTVKIVDGWTPSEFMPRKTVPFIRHPPPLKRVDIQTTRANTPKSLTIRPPPPLLCPKLPTSSLINPTNGQYSKLIMVPISLPSGTVLQTPKISGNGTSILQVVASPKSPSAGPSLPTVSSHPGSPIFASPTGQRTSPVTGAAPTLNPQNALTAKQKIVTILNKTLPGSTTSTTKFLLNCNGKMTEVIVPDLKRGGISKPKYIVMDKSGNASGLVIESGKDVIQLPILNKISEYKHETSNSVVSVPTNPTSLLVRPTLTTRDSAGKEKTCTGTKDIAQNKPAPTTDGNSKDNNSRDLVSSSQSTLELPLKLAIQRKPGINPALCSIKRLFAGPDALLRVFEFLNHEDLSRACCVSRAWKWLGSQTDLWRTVNLSDTCVHDWEKLAALIQKFKSTRLDMRKMKTFDDYNRTWHCFIAQFRDYKSIEHIDFGFVPVAYLTPIARNLTQLKVLTAEHIVDYSNSQCRLDIGIFDKMENLVELRLRGHKGLHLPTFSVSGLESLIALKQLKQLSITTLLHVDAEKFTFIKSLVNLTNLELGECKSWTNEIYSYLGELSNLKELKLEVGAAFPDVSLCNALSKLSRLTLLELNDYIINENYVPIITNLSSLEHLIVTPSIGQTPKLVNSSILNGLNGLKNLKSLDWTLLTNDPKKVNDLEENVNESDGEEVTASSNKNDIEEVNDSFQEDSCISIVIEEKDRHLEINELKAEVKLMLRNDCEVTIKLNGRKG